MQNQNKHLILSFEIQSQTGIPTSDKIVRNNQIAIPPLKVPSTIAPSNENPSPKHVQTSFKDLSDTRQNHSLLQQSDAKQQQIIQSQPSSNPDCAIRGDPTNSGLHVREVRVMRVGAADSGEAGRGAAVGSERQEERRLYDELFQNIAIEATGDNVYQMQQSQQYFNNGGGEYTERMYKEQSSLLRANDINTEHRKQEIGQEINMVFDCDRRRATEDNIKLNQMDGQGNMPALNHNFFIMDKPGQGKNHTSQFEMFDGTKYLQGEHLGLNRPRTTHNDGHYGSKLRNMAYQQPMQPLQFQQVGFNGDKTIIYTNPASKISGQPQELSTIAMSPNMSANILTQQLIQVGQIYTQKQQNAEQYEQSTNMLNQNQIMMSRTGFNFWKGSKGKQRFDFDKLKEDTIQALKNQSLSHRNLDEDRLSHLQNGLHVSQILKPKKLQQSTKTDQTTTVDFTKHDQISGSHRIPSRNLNYRLGLSRIKTAGTGIGTGAAARRLHRSKKRNEELRSGEGGAFKIQGRGDAGGILWKRSDTAKDSFSERKYVANKNAERLGTSMSQRVLQTRFIGKSLKELDQNRQSQEGRDSDLEIPNQRSSTAFGAARRQTTLPPAGDATPSKSQNKIFGKLLPERMIQNRHLKVNDRLLIKNSKYFLSSARSNMIDQTLKKVQHEVNQKASQGQLEGAISSRNHRKGDLKVITSTIRVNQNLDQELNKDLQIEKSPEIENQNPPLPTQSHPPPAAQNPSSESQPTFLTCLTKPQVQPRSSSQSNLLLAATTSSLLRGARLTTRELMSLCHDGKIPGRLRNSEQEVVDQPHYKNKAEDAIANILAKIKDQVTDDYFKAKGQSHGGQSGQFDQLTFGADQQQQTDFSNLSSDNLLMQNNYNGEQRHDGKESMRDSITTLKTRNKSRTFSHSSSSHRQQNLKKVQIPQLFNLNLIQCTAQTANSKNKDTITPNSNPQNTLSFAPNIDQPNKSQGDTCPSVFLLEPQSSSTPAPVFQQRNVTTTLPVSRQDKEGIDASLGAEMGLTIPEIARPGQSGNSLSVKRNQRGNKVAEMSILNTDGLIDQIGDITLNHTTVLKNAPKSKFLQKTQSFLHDFQGKNKGKTVKGLKQLKFTTSDIQAPQCRPIILSDTHQELTQLQQTINIQKDMLKQLQSGPMKHYGPQKQGKADEKAKIDKKNQKREGKDQDKHIVYQQQKMTNYQMIFADDVQGKSKMTQNQSLTAREINRFNVRAQSRQDPSSTSDLTPKVDFAVHRMPITTVPKVVFQKKLNDEKIKDEFENDRIYNPLDKEVLVKQSLKRRVSDRKSRVLVVKGVKHHQMGSVVLKNSDIAIKLDHLYRSKSQQNKQSSDSVTYKKGQFEQSSAATGLLSKSELRMQNVYDRSSKDITKSIIAKEVSIYDAPYKNNENVVQSLIFSGRSSQINESNTPIQRKCGGEGDHLLKQSILSLSKNIDEPTISFKRVRNKSQQFITYKQNGQTDKEFQDELQNAVVLLEEEPGEIVEGETISNIQIQHDFEGEQAQKRLINKDAETERREKALYQLQIRGSGEVAVRGLDTERSLQRRRDQEDGVVLAVDPEFNKKQTTKGSRLEKMFNQSYIMVCQDKKSVSLKPPPLKRLQDQTYRERFGFRDEGYALRMLKEWIQLKNPRAKIKRVRYLSEKNQQQTEQIKFIKMLVQDYNFNNGLKYDYKAVKLLRDFRTEKQIQSFLHTSQLFVENLKQKERLTSKEEDLRQFQEYMDQIDISEVSEHIREDEQLVENSELVEKPQLQLNQNYIDFLQRQKHQRRHKRNFTINEEDSKSTILHDSQMTPQVEKSYQVPELQKKQAKHRSQLNVHNPIIQKQPSNLNQQLIHVKKEQSYRYLKVMAQTTSGKRQQNKDIFFEDQVKFGNIVIQNYPGDVQAPAHTSSIPKASSNSDENKSEERLQQLRELKVRYKFEDESDCLQVANLPQSSEQKTLRLIPITESAESMDYKRKFRNFDLIQGIDSKHIASHDSEESNFQMQTRIHTAPKKNNKKPILVQGRQLKTIEKLKNRDIETPNKSSLNITNIQLATPQTIERPESPNPLLPSQQQFHHFRVKIPSQMEVNLSAGNSKRYSGKVVGAKKGNMSQVYNLNHFNDSRNPDTMSDSLGRTLQGIAATPKNHRGIMVATQQQRQEGAPLNSEDFTETLVASDKLLTPFFIQGESLNNTQQLDSSQFPGTGSRTLKNQDLSSSLRLKKRMRSSGKTLELLIIGGQALISNSHTNSGSPSKHLKSHPRIQARTDDIQLNRVSGPSLQSAKNGTSLAQVTEFEKQELANDSKVATKLKERLGLMQKEQEKKEIGRGIKLKQIQLPDMFKYKDEKGADDIDIDMNTTIDKFYQKQETMDKQAKKEENVIRNIQKYKNKNTGKSLEVKSLKPKAFVFRMYAKDSAIHDAEELQQAGIFEKRAKYL